MQLKQLKKKSRCLEYVHLPPPLLYVYGFAFTFPAVCSIPGKEVLRVCLLGRPWDPVLSRTWDWTAYLPSLSGKRTPLACIRKYSFDKMMQKGDCAFISWLLINFHMNGHFNEMKKKLI